MSKTDVGISLGWNCASAVWGVGSGIRSTKQTGYKTCPFDEMMSNYPGVIRCIEEDFAGFTDSENLIIKHIEPGLDYIDYSDYCQDIIINKKYNFAFNHESPGHPFLPETQGWPGGKQHYCLNDFYHFKERYNKRIQNFRDYLSDPNNTITFILSRHNTRQEDLGDLNNVLKKKYPTLDYKIIILETDLGIAKNNYKLMGLGLLDPEIARLGS
jgi:hypothetical protein